MPPKRTLRPHGLWLVAIMLAGCLAPAAVIDPAEGADHGIIEPRTLVGVSKIVPFEAAARDGEKLRGLVFVPEGEGPFPTVLIYSPYWGNARATGEALLREVDGMVTIAGVLGNLSRAGYAVAAVNIRGSGVSSGCFSYINPIDGPDAAAVIDQLAREDWSDGQVAMFGGSYEAWTQYNAMIHAGPALKTVIPVSGTIDQWKLLTRAGAPVRLAAIHPILRDVGQGLGTDGLASTSGPRIPPRFTTDNAFHMCPDTVTDVHAYHEAVRTGDKSEFFTQRDIMDELAEHATVPALASFGLGQGEGHILQSEGIWPLLPSGSRLLLGQWGHAYPVLEDQAYMDLVVAWLDHHMRGGPAVETGFVDYQDATGRWHRSPEWPPASTEVILALRDDALVLQADDIPESSKSYHAVPLTPTGSNCLPRLVRYVSPPVEENVTLAGNFVVELTLSSTLPDSNIAAYLFTVDGSGGCDEGKPVEIRRALGDLYHRGHLEIGKDFPLDRPDRVILTSLPFATVVPQGSRIILAIGGGSREFLPSPMQPTITVHAGGADPAIIRLPVVEGTFSISGQDRAPDLAMNAPSRMPTTAPSIHGRL